MYCFCAYVLTLNSGIIVWVANDETFKSILLLLKKEQKKLAKKRYKHQIFHVTWHVETNFIVTYFWVLKFFNCTLSFDRFVQ